MNDLVYAIYKPKKFRPDTELIIATADDILTDFAERGYDLTLRQLYYQFVARNLINNTERDYKRLASVVNDARLAGLLPWNALVDRTRRLRSVATWETPQELLRVCAEQYRVNPWVDQPVCLEVWIEKDALLGVIAGVCERYAVPYFSCRGFVSLTAMYEAAQRIEQRSNPTLILHLGDHDPSGIDMTRDITERLYLLCGGHFEVKRIALSYKQVVEFKLPPNPAKPTDARWRSYAAQYGTSSWELDALEPEVIAAMVESYVRAYADEELLQESLQREEQERGIIRRMAEELESRDGSGRVVWRAEDDEQEQE